MKKIFSWQDEETTVANVAKATVRNAPRVLITPEAKRRLDLYIALAEGEISGLGRVSRLGPDLLVEEVFLFEQESGPGNTELDTEAVARWITELVKLGQDPSQIKLWWHSHSNMSVFWSGTDEATARRFSNGWMLFLVGNKQGEYLVRLDLYEPLHLTIDGLEFQIHWPEDESLKAEVEAEIAAKVRKRMVLPNYDFFRSQYSSQA